MCNFGPHSEQRDKLFEALANAQGEFGEIIPTGQAEYGMYATYLDMVRPTRDALKKNGLSVNFIPSSNESNKRYLKVKLNHSSGQFDSGEMELVVESEITTRDGRTVKRNYMQAYGSATTYAMRTLYKTILGLAINDADDDDGSVKNNNNEKDQDNKQSNAPKQNFNNGQQKPLNGLATQPQIDSIVRRLKSSPEYVDKLIKKFGLLTNMPKQFASTIIDSLKNNKPLPPIDDDDKQVTMYEQDGNIIEGSSDFEEVDSDLPF